MVVSMGEIEVLLFATFWNFFFSDIFDWWLVESTDVEPADKEVSQ